MSDYSSFMNRRVTCEEHIADVSVSISSRFHQLVTDIKTLLSNRKQRRIDNIAFKYMLQLDDAMLKDIGVSRGDVIWPEACPWQQMRRWNWRNWQWLTEAIWPYED